MREFAPLPESGFRVNWAKLNNELFAKVYADPDLRIRYERATSAEAQDMCSELFDHLAEDAVEFVARFIVVER